MNKIYYESKQNHHKLQTFCYNQSEYASHIEKHNSQTRNA